MLLYMLYIWNVANSYTHYHQYLYLYTYICIQMYYSILTHMSVRKGFFRLLDQGWEGRRGSHGGLVGVGEMKAQQFSGFRVNLRRYGQEQIVRNQHHLSHFRAPISVGSLDDGVCV